MVVAGKIFKLVELTPLPELATTLSGYEREEPYEEGDYKFTLVTEITNLLPQENAVAGIYSHDYVLHVFHRGKVVPLPRTVGALFSFAQLGKQLFLSVVEKKSLANFIANKLSELLYGKVGRLLRHVSHRRRCATFT